MEEWIKHIIDVIEANEAMDYTDEYKNGEDKDLLTVSQEGLLLEALVYLLALILVIGIALYIKGYLIF